MPAFPKSEIDNEEAAVFAGLKDFLRGLIADRKSAKQRDGLVKVSLFYAT